VARFAGTVVHGNGRGKKLGFPTANLDVDTRAVADGVYVAWVRIGGAEWMPATVSVGDNPTFRNVEARRMECHVHGLDHDIYGERIEVEIVALLRRMIAFVGADQLIEQTARDVRASAAVLASARPPAAG